MRMTDVVAKLLTFAACALVTAWGVAFSYGMFLAANSSVVVATCLAALVALIFGAALVRLWQSS